MATNPLNRAFRFLLELVALFSLGYWGWTQHDGIGRFLWAIGLPVVAAVAWGSFAVRDDPSRSGKAPVPVPGWLRLLLELALFAGATWLWMLAGRETWGIILAVAVVIHYALSYDRIAWLLRA